MERIEILEKILIYDRLLRFTIDLLTGIRTELLADIEETKILSESLLSRTEREVLNGFLHKVESEFILKLEEVLENIYDVYEMFNFDITFLSNLPQELGREIERLDILTNVNSKLQNLMNILLEACSVKTDNKFTVILTPFKMYCELINHAIDFNKKFENF